MKTSVSSVLKKYADAYIERHGTTMTSQQKKVLRAVAACREDSLGTIRYRCVNCGGEQTVPRSCCNRHCPVCQWDTQQQWLAQQTRLLLPCHYFLITFTLPGKLRSLAMQNPDVVYRVMFAAAADALRKTAKIPRHIGADQIGMLGVLHTWGRDLTYHPHVHFLVPGGGLDGKSRWRSSRQSVFVPEQVLEYQFKRNLKSRLDQAGLLGGAAKHVLNGRVVVDSKPVGSGKHALKYLAPYVSRGCVANWRVTQLTTAKGSDPDSLDGAKLSLQVKRSGERHYRPLPLSVSEFIRRWLQHVVPSGMHRVRRYGLMHPSSRWDFDELCLVIAAAIGVLHVLLCTEEIVTPQSDADGV